MNFFKKNLLIVAAVLVLAGISTASAEIGTIKTMWQGQNIAMVTLNGGGIYTLQVGNGTSYFVTLDGYKQLLAMLYFALQNNRAVEIVPVINGATNYINQISFK